MGGSSNRLRKTYIQRGITRREHLKVAARFREFKRTKIYTTPIIFTDEEIHDVVQPHDDALVVTVEVTGKNVSKILVDIGSSVDIIFKYALEQLDARESTMEEVTVPLVGSQEEVYGLWVLFRSHYPWRREVPW